MNRRRAWTGVTLAVALLLAGVLADQLRRRKPSPHKANFVIFGGITQVELRGVDDAAASAAFGAIGQQLQRDQRAWHPWETSDLMRLNAAIAQGQSYPASPELAGLLRRARAGYDASGGLFNPAIGSLIALWGFHTSNYPLTTPPPPQENIDAVLAANARMDDLDIAADGTVRSRNPRVKLDLNGLAEGYAAEQIAALLAEHGVRVALINVGGDVLALGTAGDRPWRVGISSPQQESLAGIALQGREALFSSGNYNKFREIDGQRWGHVLDPRSGRPARGVAAVSVIHADAVVADLAATTLMIAGPAALVPTARALGVRCVVLVDEEGSVWITPALQQRLQFTTPPPRLIVTEDLGAGCAG